MAEPQTNRLVSIDALRGIAVLGILMMNVQGFAMTPMAYDDPTMMMDLTGANLTVWSVAHTFFALKFITIFSTLFGAGIILMTGDGDSTGKHYPRMLWLLLIGAIHAYIFWWGDILVHYALLGMIAVNARKMSVGKLTIFGILLILVGGLIMVGLTYLGAMFTPAEGAAQEQQMMADMQAGMIESFQAGFLQHIPMNALFAVIGQVFSFIFMGPRTLGLMFLGMALYKSGFLSAAWSTSRYLILSVVMIAVGVYLNWMSTTTMINGEFSAQAKADGLAWSFFGSVVLSFGYASLVMLLSKIGAFKLLIAWFASVGRMAFTNYLSQTLIMTFIFVGAPGLGLFGTVERVDQLKLVLLVWAIQLIWSPLWLSRFKFGPLEWLWRSLTYGKLQPIVKR